MTTLTPGNPPILRKEMKRDDPFHLTVRGEAGFFASYDTIRCDFKASPSLDAKPVISLDLGTGLQVTGTDLILSITPAQTRAIRTTQLYADVRLWKDSDPDKPLTIIRIEAPVVSNITNKTL